MRDFLLFTAAIGAIALTVCGVTLGGMAQLLDPVGLVLYAAVARSHYQGVTL